MVPTFYYISCFNRFDQCIVQKYDANVVLSLDRLKVNDKITELLLDDGRSYYTALVAWYESQWSIHYPGKDNYEKLPLEIQFIGMQSHINVRKLYRSYPRVRMLWSMEHYMSVKFNKTFCSLLG